MVFGREVLGEVIGKVLSSLLPVEAELVLFDASAHPVEAHIKIFGALPAHVAGEDSVGGHAVGIDWGWRLQLAHIDEGRADGNSLLAVEEDRSSFGLSGRSHDGAYGLTFGEYQSIRSGSRSDVGRWWIVDQLLVARSATSRFGLNWICCITVDVESHIASVEPDDGVWLRFCVVHQHPRFLDGVGGGKSLLGAYFVECGYHGGFDGAIVLEKGYGNSFHARDAAFIKFRCSRGVGRVLRLGPIRRRKLFLGIVLRARGYGVLEALQVFADGFGHGDVDVVFRVVPIDGKSAVLAARRVNGDGVILP